MKDMKKQLLDGYASPLGGKLIMVPISLFKKIEKKAVKVPFGKTIRLLFLIGTRVHQRSKDILRNRFEYCPCWWSPHAANARVKQIKRS